MATYSYCLLNARIDMEVKRWTGKPYHSLNHYFMSVYGEKIYKVAIHGGMTCPNRDGVLDTRGCIFCSKGGSGEFAVPINAENPDITAQLQLAREKVREKMPEGRIIPYFQPYTNTYATVEYLERVYTEALSPDDVVGISIATRPDCLSEDVIKLFIKLKAEYPDKFIWVELGLQTIHRRTAQYIRRGYELSVFEDAVKKLNEIQLPIIVHVILGLPGESRQDMTATIEYLNTFNIFGVKLQLLHVLKETDLAIEYENNTFDVLTMEEYIDILIDCIEHLSPQTVIHRVTGDGPKSILIAPLWSGNKKLVLNTLLKEMDKRETWQGKKYEGTGFFNVI